MRLPFPLATSAFPYHFGIVGRACRTFPSSSYNSSWQSLPHLQQIRGGRTSKQRVAGSSPVRDAKPRRATPIKQ